MSSLKCHSCGLVNFAEAEKCKRCGKPLTAALNANRSKLPPRSEAQSSGNHTPENASNKNSSDSKTLLRVLPLVIFGVPLFLVSKDRLFGPKPKVGGYTDTFQLLVLAGCAIGFIVTLIVMVLTRKK